MQITTLKDDIEGLRVQMLKEISSLKEDLDRERKAREALEKEVSVSTISLQFLELYSRSPISGDVFE